MVWELSAFELVVALMAVEVVCSDQHVITGDDHDTSFVQGLAEVCADLIELPHQVLDLLLTEYKLLAMLNAVTKG